MPGGRHRDIPGFYFDPERQRYFAVPTSSSVAGFNSEEIHKLDSRIKGRKRVKHEKEKDSYGNKETHREKLQAKYFSELEYWQERALKIGTTHRCLRKIVSKRSNSLNSATSTRVFQNAVLEKTMFLLPEITNNVSGMRLVFWEVKGAYEPFCIVFYKTNVNSQEIWLEIREPSFLYLSHQPTVSNVEEYLTSQLRLVNPSVHRNFIQGYNGHLIFDNMIQSFSGQHIDYLLSSTIFCSKNTIHLGKYGTFRPKSEITCIYYLDGVVAYGCRNGTVGIIWEVGKHLEIQTSFPVCGLVLLTLDEQLLCVVSNVNNKLRSYTIDELKLEAMEFLSYNDYHWSWRLSNNMKNDLFVKGIFCIESETADPSKLELLFYHLLCPRPLQMLEGPFFIENTNKSETEWFLCNTRLAIFSPKDQSLKLYRPAVGI